MPRPWKSTHEGRQTRQPLADALAWRPVAEQNGQASGFPRLPEVGELFQYVIENQCSREPAIGALVVNATSKQKSLDLQRSVHTKHPLNGLRLHVLPDCT
jgi:hypothetical protein